MRGGKWYREIRSAILVMALAMSLLVSGSASAASVLLSDLLAGGTLTSGQFTFSDFEYLPSASAPTPNLISVSTVTNGLMFQTPLLNTSSQTFIDFNIAYTVTALSPIIGMCLESTGFTINSGVAVVITNVNDDAELLAALANFYTSGEGAPGVNSATSSFEGPNSVRVKTDVGLVGSTAGLSDWTHTFKTDGHVIPSPAAGLAGLSLLGLLVTSRRRNIA